MIDVVREDYTHGVSTRRMEKLAQSLGIDGTSGSYVSKLTKGLNEQAEEFRSRPLSGHEYPLIWADALYEKVRSNGVVVCMAVSVICGVNEEGRCEILAVEPMAEESEASYTEVFRKLKERGMETSRLAAPNGAQRISLGAAAEMQSTFYEKHTHSRAAEGQRDIRRGTQRDMACSGRRRSDKKCRRIHRKI